jgi:amidase
LTHDLGKVNNPFYALTVVIPLSLQCRQVQTTEIFAAKVICRNREKEAKVALRAAGHEVVDVEFLKPDDGLWDLAVRIFCADGGEMLRKMLAICPEPVIKEFVVPPSSMVLSASELESGSKTLLQTRQEFLRRLQDTKALTALGRPVDVLVLPSGAHVAPPHSTMEYFLYEAISNILDWPCATIPVGNVDARLDPKPISRDGFIPLSEQDRKNWEKCTQKNCLFFPKLNAPCNCTNIHFTDSPNTYENGAICLQILGPRFGEEVVLATMRVLNEALGRRDDDLL